MASKRTTTDGVGAVGEGTAKKKKLNTKTRTRKKALKATSFVEYLKSEALVKDYFLTKNKNLSFHWANWSETCEYQKDFLFSDVSNEMKLKNLNDELFELKKTEVWLKNKRGCVKMSLYDVYEGYLDNRLRMTWFERDGILMSFENEAGPYMSLANMKWFNKNIYAAFMFKKLLTKPIPFRGFRVGMEAPIEGKFDNSPLNSVLLRLHQASEFGVILKVEGKNNLAKLENSETIQLEIDVTPFLETKDGNFEDIISSFEKYNFETNKGKNRKIVNLSTNIMKKYNNDRNAVSGGGEHFYFFVPYTELFKAPQHQELQAIFSNFVKKVKDELDSELKKAA